MLKNRKKAGRPVGKKDGDTRRDVLALIASGKGDLTLAEMGEMLGTTGQTVGYHLGQLRERGQVQTLSTGIVVLTEAGAQAFKSQESAA